jgi:cytochrome P450
MHDPDTFEDPMGFNPERYLDQNGSLDSKVLDPDDAAFGYGRRLVHILPIYPMSARG